MNLPLKRYAIVLQHEVIVYAYEEKQAENIALKAYPRESKCIYIRQLPNIETEAQEMLVVDKRIAPGQ